jgi:hypothetical protein
VRSMSCMSSARIRSMGAGSITSGRVAAAR